MKNKAFTLAEVLITLSIIGVVAALTIPSLIVKNQEKETVVQLKKAYNVFSNAFSLAVIEYGDPSSWEAGAAGGSIDGGAKILDKLEPFLNLTRRCNGTRGCFPPGVKYKYYNGVSYNATIWDNDTRRAKAILADGMTFSIWNLGSSCGHEVGISEALKHACGEIHIDVNGQKGPNIFGKDMFSFYITQNSIQPMGSPDATTYPLSNCLGSGFGCTAWVLLKENFSYPSDGKWSE